MHVPKLSNEFNNLLNKVIFKEAYLNLNENKINNSSAEQKNFFNLLSHNSTKSELIES